MVGLVGRWLGNYRVDQYIDGGGMCDVYKVFDREKNVSLAMKVLKESLLEDNPEAVKSIFHREVRAYKVLQHPNIVRCFGSEETPEAVFMLLSFIDGLSLKDLIKQRKQKITGQLMSIPEALAFLKAMCAALGYAHHGGVVHCDVKPGNVMVDRGGAIYMMDFGIARHAESDSTDFGGPVGTWRYMAPEQFEGNVYTPATDIYPLGVMLFEMLTGRHPFAGKEAETGSSGKSSKMQLRDAHQYQPPPDPCDLNPATPPALGAVILKALEKDPANRYQTTDELFTAACQASGMTREEVPDRVNLPEIQALEPLTLLHQPPLTYPTPPTEKDRPGFHPPKKLLAAVIMGGGLLLVLAVAITVAVLSRRGGDGGTPFVANTSITKTAISTSNKNNPIPNVTQKPGSPSDTPLGGGSVKPATQINNSASSSTSTRVPSRTPSKTPTRVNSRTPTRIIPKTSTRVPSRTPTKTQFATRQPVINATTNKPAQCDHLSHLRSGMYAFAQKEVIIYNIPRYDVSDESGAPDPVPLYRLQPGDRVLIDKDYYQGEGATNPMCTRNSYFWHITTAFEDPQDDPHIDGWVFEYYYYHRKDENRIHFDNGTFLGPNPPP